MSEAAAASAAAVDNVDVSLGSSSLPGTLFKLNGSNFGEWKAETMAELQEKGYWPQVEDEKKANTDPANIRAKGFIIRRIAFDLQHLIPKDANAAKAWNEVCKR